MVTEQLYGISKIINNISKEVIAETQFDTPLEEELLKALNKKDIYPNDITVIKNANGRYEANLSINACMGAKVCDKIITPIFSMVTGTNMCKNNTDCATAKKSKQCYLQLTEQKRFSISCAAIRQAKDGQKINGDNYSTMPIKDGRYIMAISDGMGSGIDAASQSDTTVKLLEKFLHAGFDKSSAIKLINSVLLLRSSNETFATIDIALIDLFSGDAEFIKIGANTTYIKSGNKTERIISTSLPAGILGEVDIEAVRKKLHDNDFIIMLSDGVENVQDLWVEAYLSTITDTSPQLLANHLMRKAVERSGRIMDDMTILVGKVSKLI
jgi:stage II sporulation protein E